MACLDAANFQKLMYDRETAIHEEILDYFSKQDNVWNKDVVIANAPWSDGDGYLREKVRHHMGPNPQLDHSELWSTVEQSYDNNEAGVEPGDPYYDESLAHSNCATGSCQDLEIGLEKFTYRPKQSCLRGPQICAEDIRHAWMFQQVMEKHTKSYAEAVASHKSRWNRDTYIGLSQRFPAQENYEFLDPVRGVLPTVPVGLDVLPMSVGLLDARYPQLSIEAAQWSAGRTAYGNPVFTVLLPPEDITQVMRDYFGSDVFLNQGTSKLAESYMEGLNTPFSVGNWAFKADLYGNRFTRNAATGAFERVTPFVDETANITGKRWRVNPAWIKAPYAEAVILMREVFKNRIYPSLSTVGGGSRLGSADNGLIDWDGKPTWTYVPSECDPYGLTGRYRMHFKRAAEPLDCDLSYTIIYKRCPYGQIQKTCVTGTGCDSRAACEEATTTFACEADGNDLTVVANRRLTLVEGDAVVVTFSDASTVNGTVSEVSEVDGFEYVITLGEAADCGDGVTSIVVAP
jgi:hypothetical protein